VPAWSSPPVALELRGGHILRHDRLFGKSGCVQYHRFRGKLRTTLKLVAIRGALHDREEHEPRRFRDR
jgi:hypothetical protein